MAFADTINEDITLNFSQEGSPLFVTMKKPDYIECTLIMTTVMAEDVSFYEECLETEVTEPVGNANLKNKRKNQNRNNSTSNINNTSKAIKRKLSEETTLSNDTTLFEFNTNRTHASFSSVQAERNLTQCDHDVVDSNNLILAAACPETPDIIFNDNQNQVEENETIPQSPQMSKIRTIFARCFEATYIPKEPSPNSEIFVPNSDTEE